MPDCTAGFHVGAWLRQSENDAMFIGTQEFPRTFIMNGPAMVAVYVMVAAVGPLLLQSLKL